MSKQFALDLRLARKKSGLTQRDIAHLLSANSSRISDLEHGKRSPSIKELCKLSLVYGRTFESFYGEVLAEVRIQLRQRMTSVPKDIRLYAGTFNRSSSLARLRDRLAEETGSEHAA